MAEKHKSKYKKPENTKYKSRKDLKDYTSDDKNGSLNPFSTKEKQTNVLRKTDKEMVDDGKYDVKYNADDRLYKDLEDGEYDPKHASKVFKKRQDKEEKETADVLKDKVENLTREQKERLVREYIRRTIVKQLIEQEEKEADAATEEPAAETPPADTAAAPAAETPPAEPTPGEEPAPEAGATTTPPATPSAAPSAAPTTPPAGDEMPAAEPKTTEPAADEKEETPEDKAKEKIAKQQLALRYWEETLADQSGPNMLVDTGFDPLAKALSSLGAKDLRLAKMMILRRLSKIKPAAATTEKTK